MTDALANLVEVQNHDTRLAQLQYRRSHMEQRTELASVEDRIAAIDRELVEPAAARRSFETREQALEDEQASVSVKIAAAERTLYSGSVSSPRELQALESDIASLKRRRSELEDHELELLVEREPVDARLATAADQIDVLESRRIVLQESIRDEEHAIDAEAALASAARATLVATVPSDLLGFYDRARVQNKGIGIARLEHGICGACRLKLAAVDFDRIRQQPPDAIVRCDDCGALLLR